MKVSSLALVAWMLVGQFALAEEPGGAVALPPGSRVSPAAQNAAEAPRWNQSPAPSTASPPANAAAPSAAPNSTTVAPTPTAAAPGATAGLPSSVPGTSPSPAAPQPTSAQPTAAQPPQQLPLSDDAKPLSPATADNANNPTDNADAAADQPRPLYSVMVRHDPKTPAPAPAAPTSEVAPARYEEPLPAPPARSQTIAPANSTGGRPANTTVIETPVDPEKVAAARATADLLATSFDPFNDGVKPISLLEALTQADEQARPAVIRDYWRLSRAWSDCHWAEDEAKRLESVVPARSSVDSPMVSTARAAAAARVNEAKVGIQAAQDALMRSAHLQIQNDTYRPSDAPLVGPYHTYFSALFANRQPPGRTLQIDRTLPLRLKAINDRTAAVQSATTAIHSAEEAHAKGESDMRTVLSCHEELYRQRRALLDEVLAYNLDIGDYAATVAAPGTPNEKLVAMLIEAKSSQRMSAVPTVPTAASDPATPSVRTNTSAVRAATNDGWVPSTMRSIERSPR